MEYLNLQKDDGDSLENKYILLNGVSYYIGNFISKAKTKLVYQLYNAKSHVSSHVIKIYRNASDETKLMNELVSSEIMHRIDIESPNIILPNQEERKLMYQGGLFHVEELLTSNREYDNEELDQAKQLFFEQCYQKAMDLFKKQLKINPYQTEAILGIFFCNYQINGFQARELRLLDQILDIEPHVKYYYQVGMLVCLFNKYYEGFLHFYQKSKQHSIQVNNVFEKVNVMLEKADEPDITENIEELKRLYEKEFQHFYDSCIDVPLTDIVGDNPFAYGKSLIQFKSNHGLYALVAYDYADAFNFNADDEIFDEAVELFNKDCNNIVAYEMMEDLVERNPKEKKYIQVFLSMAYVFKKYSEFVRVYRDMNPNNSTEQLDGMAVEVYLKVGDPEKALALSMEVRIPSELRQIIQEEIEKKRKQAKLSEKAYLALSEEKDPEKAIELQRKATEIYPFGFEALINQLIDCIENGKNFCMVDQIFSFTVHEYAYYLLHVCIYKILRKEFDEGFRHIILEYSEFVEAYFNDLDSDDDIPGKLIWFNEKGVMEEPLDVTYKILLEGYKAVKDFESDELGKYGKLIEKYKAAAEIQAAGRFQ